MKGLNVRLLAILVGTGIVLAIAVLVVHRFQSRHQAKFLLDEARQILKNQDSTYKDREKAAKNIGRYLGYYSRETDVRAELGLLLADLTKKDPKYFTPAFSTLEQVLREDALQDDVRRQTIDLAMRMHQFDDALEHIDILRNRTPNDGRLMELRAQCEAAKKEYTKAKESYKKAIAMAPDLLNAYMGLAKLFQLHGEDIAAEEALATRRVLTENDNENDTKGKTENDQPKEETPPEKVDDNNIRSEKDKPDYWVNRMVEKNPESARAYFLRGEYLRTRRQYKEAQQDVNKALEIAPKDLDNLLLAMQVATDLKDYDQARTHGEQAVKLFKHSPRVYRTLCNVELRADNQQQALQWIEDGLAATNNDPSLTWEKAIQLINLKKLDEVPSLISKLRDSKDSIYRQTTLISYLEGRLAFARKEWASARSFYEPIRSDLARYSRAMAFQATRELIECYLKLNQNDMARKLREEMAESTAGSKLNRADSWKQLAASGRLSQALAKYRESLKTKGDSVDNWIEYTKLLIYQNDHFPRARRDWTEAERAVNKVAELDPETPELPVMQAKILLEQNRLDEARTILEDAVKQNPTRWELWDPLVVMAQHDKQWDRAEALLDEAERHVVAKTSIHIARARLAVVRDGEKSSEELKKLGEKAGGMAESEKLFYWRTLAGFCLAAKDFEQAKIYCQKAANQDPSDLKIRMLLIEIARQTDDEATMRKAIDEIGKIEQHGPVWNYYMAQLLVMFNENKDKTLNYKKAIAHLDEAQKNRPEWADVPMLLGKIQDQLGNKGAAIESLQTAVKLGSRDPKGLGRLIDLLYEEGRDDEAAQNLALLNQASPNATLPTGAIWRRGVQLMLEGKVEEGIAEMKKVADKLRKRADQSKDYIQSAGLARVLRTLAQISLRQNKPDDAKAYFKEAEKYLRRAIELAPQNSSLWIDLVVLMAEAGQTREVSDVLSEAKNKLPPDEVALTLAQCYQVLGRDVEAEQQYEKAARENADNKRLARLMARFYLRSKDPEKAAKGVKILHEMIDGKRPINERDLPWARRNLVVLLAKKGDHRSYHDAMQLVEANLQKNPESILDLRLKGKLLSRRPSRKDRRKALEIFEQLVKLPKPSADDRFELAMLMFTDERWSEASEQLQALLTSKSARPEWYDFCIRAQIRAKEYNAAEAKLDRYAEMVNNPYPVAVIKARIYSGRKRHDRSIRIIKDYVEDASSTNATLPTRLRQGAQALENLAKHVTGPGRDAAIVNYLEQAEKYYRELVEKDPSAAKYLVNFLGQRGRRDEALTIAEKYWNSDPTPSIVISAISLLTFGDPSTKDIQRAEKILNDTVARNKKELAKANDRIKQLKESNHSNSSEMKRTQTMLYAEQAQKKALRLASAELQSIKKHYNEAEKIYREVLTEDPDNVVALNNLAVFLALRGLKLNDAQQMIDKAIELSGPMATILDSRATVRLAQGKWEEALDDLSMALSEEQTGIRYFHKAQALAQGGKKREAAEAMREADNYGLKAELLQPLERPAYRQLREELQK